VFDIGIAYREDVDHVIGVVQALAADLRADEEYAWRILEPIEILGLDQFADSAVIVKARIKTKPIQQWNVMREFNRRLKRRFDELDIEMPFPHQTIYFGADRQGPASPSANGAGHGVVVRLKLPRNANGDERFLPSR
jgi:small conductance mechanosensitive channel